MELERRADRLDAQFGAPGAGGRPALASLYLGGGTPSLLGAEAVGGLVALVRDRYGLDADAEVTLEANPGPDERGDPRDWRDAGITRLSIGAQAMDRASLRRLGRRHGPEDVGAAVAEARAAGIGSVSIDLLYDVPDQALGTWFDTLDAALALEPDHLSLYALTLDDPDAEGLAGPGGDHLPLRAGARRWREAATAGQDEDRAVAAYHHATTVLGEAGYRGYELSNWARPGHESRHNLAYWTRRPYEAVGPGAHAFDGVTRRWNAAALDGWLSALEAPGGEAPVGVLAGLPPGGEERLDEATALLEAVILGLRLDTGLPRAAAFERPLVDAFGWALAAGLLDVADHADGVGERIRLTTRGRLLSNELFARLG